MRFRYRNDHVRLDAPSILPVNSSRLVSSVSFGRSIVSPRNQSLDVGLRQFWRISKIPVARVREPWRHLLTQNRFLNRSSPWTRAFVGQEGHWRNFAGPVTELTISLEYRKHILVKRHRTGLVGNRRRNLRRQRCYGRQNNDQEESRHKRLLGWVFGT